MALLRSDFPTITVEVDFGLNAFSVINGWVLGTSALGTNTILNTVGSWTDISSYVRGFSISRGRSNELTGIEAGTATVILNNRDRRFEPAFAAGPYYPYVVPLRRIRISALWSGENVKHYLFNGFVEQWPQDWTHSPQDQETAITCTDGFEPLNQAQVNATFVQDFSGNRVNAVLTNVSWPSSEINTEVGSSQVQGITLAGTSALQHIQDIANSEFGLFFFTGDGTATFQARSHRTNTLTSVATFGDNAATEIPYESISVPGMTKDSIYNDAQVTRTGGTLQEVTDATSQTSYFKRTYSASPQLVADTDALNMASYIVGNYKDPQLRVQSITVRPTMQTSTLWAQALGREISDRITIIRRPPAGGASITGDFFIDGISHTVQMGTHGWEWRTTFNLASANLYSGWVLGTSQLGTNTKLAW